MVWLFIGAAFALGVVVGVIIAAIASAFAVANQDRVEDVLPVVTVPAPEPVVLSIPEPVVNKFTCVLEDEDGIKSVRQMAHLPPEIHRYHGMKASKTYRYDGVNDDGTHRFRLVTH